MSAAIISPSEQTGEFRRSTLSEALSSEQHTETQEDSPHQGRSHDKQRTTQPQQASEAISSERHAAGPETQQTFGHENGVSPFTPEDSPSYELCADPKESTSSLSTLGDRSSEPVPLVEAGSLHLPPVRTPRKKGPDGEAHKVPSEDSQRQRSSRGSLEEALSINFMRQSSEALDNAFNPFAIDAKALQEAQEVTSPTEEGCFAMDIDAHAAEARDTLGDSPIVAHLDFGARDGGGVVGPKISATGIGRLSDKFEVKEGEDAEIKQLLWVIENLQEELHISGKALGKAETHIRERRTTVDSLEDEVASAEAEQKELDENLRVIHSKLEAQLLTKLEQEDHIRVSGDKLKAVKSEIVTLDESLAKAEEQRRELERQARERRATQKLDSPEKDSGKASVAEVPPSPKSDYSSAWETSESEEEGEMVVQQLDAHRMSTSIFEENRAKLKEKGGLGGSWLRSVLGGSSQKDIESPSGQQLSSDPQPNPAETSLAKGMGQSHLLQPSTAAELSADTSEAEEDAKHS